MSNKTLFSQKFAVFSLALVTACGATLPTIPEVQARIESIRGLTYVKPVVQVEMTEEEFRAGMSKIDDEQNRITGTALSLFGFLEPDYDFAAEVKALVSGGASAAYDWERQVFVVPESVPNAVLAEAYRHELVHALQDQAFDLAPRMKRLKDAGQTDRKLALRFLTEADAVLCQYWEHHESGALKLNERADAMKAAQAKSNIPMIILGPAQIMPYAEAPHALGPFVRKHGWKGVDRIYRHPTPSTEWFLHPEKLATLRDVPIEIPQTAFPRVPRGWKKVYTDVLGEYQLLLLLQKHLKDDEARAAAAGWEGDRYNLYAGPNGDHVLIWKLLMDTSKDDAEILKALHAVSDKVTAAFGKDKHSRSLITKRRGLFLVAGSPAGVQKFAKGL